MTDLSAASRWGLPVGTLKGYMAGSSAPRPGSLEEQRLERGLPESIFERYQAAVRATRDGGLGPSADLVRGLIDRGRLGEADTHLTTLMKTVSADGIVHYADAAAHMAAANLAIAQGRRKKRSRENGRGIFWLEEALQTVLETDNLDEEAAVRVVCSCATALHGVHRYHEEIELLSEGLARFPHAALLWQRRAVARQYEEAWVDALADVAAALDCGAKAPRVAFIRGQSLAMLGQWNSAVTHFEHAIAKYQSEVSRGYSYSWLSYTYFFLNDMTEALKYEEKALVDAPHNAWHFYRKALICHQFEDIDGVAENAQHALRFDAPALSPSLMKRVKRMATSVES